MKLLLTSIATLQKPCRSEFLDVDQISKKWIGVMPYVFTQPNPNDPARIEDGTYQVVDGVVRVEHTGGGMSKRKLKEGEDPARIARQLLRARVEERGVFWDPIAYPPTKQV